MFRAHRKLNLTAVIKFHNKEVSNFQILFLILPAKFKKKSVALIVVRFVGFETAFLSLERTANFKLVKINKINKYSAPEPME